MKRTLLITLKVVALFVALHHINAPFVVGKANNYLELGYYGRFWRYLFFVGLSYSIVTLFAFARPWLRNLFLPLFLISSIAYLGYYRATGIEPGYEEFRLLMDARAMAGDAFSAYLSLFLATVTTHLPFVVAYLLFPSLHFRRWGNMVPVTLYLLALLGITIMIFNKSGRGTSGRASYITPVAHTLSYLYLSQQQGAMFDFPYEERTPLSAADLRAEGDAPPIVLMVMDESIRWNFIEFTQSNEGTTPALAHYPTDRYLNFGPTIAYGNCSDTTNFALRKLARLNHEVGDMFLSEQTVWDAAITAGYRVHLLDAQYNGKGHNYFTQTELERVNVIPAQGLRSDAELIPLIEAAVAAAPEARHFFYINKVGSHFPYYRANIETPFTPTMSNAKLADFSPLEVRNAYKNLIVHNTDQFFDALAGFMVRHPDSFILYTADHGQTFEQPGRKSTHCDTRNPDLLEGLVPMALFGAHEALTDPFIEHLYQKSHIKQHHLLVPLLLHAFGYQEEAIARYSDYPALLEASHQGYFIYNNAIPHFNPEAEVYTVTEEALEALIESERIYTF